MYRPTGRRAARRAVAASRRAANHLRLLLSAGRIARILTILKGRAAGRIACWTAAGRRIATATRRIPAAWVAAILTGIPAAPGVAVIRRRRCIAAATVVGPWLGR